VSAVNGLPDIPNTIISFGLAPVLVSNFWNTTPFTYRAKYSGVQSIT
jgi:hypothetical protein